jgi:hypothetical protein
MAKWTEDKNSAEAALPLLTPRVANGQILLAVFLLNIFFIFARICFGSMGGFVCTLCVWVVALFEQRN